MGRSVDHNSARSQHAARILWLEKNVYPARLLMRLKREESRLRLDFDAAATAEARIAVSAALHRTRSQILEVIGAPKRPSAPPAKRGSMANPIPIEASATPLDSVSDVVPALPAGSGLESDPDDMP